jgi:hypothetical protein
MCEERGLQLVLYKKKKVVLRTCNRKWTYENCVRSFDLPINGVEHVECVGVQQTI